MFALKRADVVSALMVFLCNLDRGFCYFQPVLLRGLSSRDTFSGLPNSVKVPVLFAEGLFLVEASRLKALFCATSLLPNLNFILLGTALLLAEE